MQDIEIPIVPGRGLNVPSAIQMRHDHLRQAGFELTYIPEYRLELSEIQKNIESFIGTVEIPSGLIGPLLYFDDTDAAELVYGVAATLEGALVASMNRGAKVISQSGGFRAAVLHQRMVRAPLFVLENLNQAISLKAWIAQNFEEIKHEAQTYSNHADLLEIKCFVIGRSVHAKFVYSTSDASGQNMTTTCTWHAMLWLVNRFYIDTQIKIEHYVIEGNSASDKKVSTYSMQEGRGVHVVAECFVPDTVIQKVLRTSSDAFLRYFSSSRAMSVLDGMHGYTINAANAIAAIFAATGQDMASVHESATAVLNIEKEKGGLYLSLNLPSLVIGTVGGGTHLQKQKEAMEIMGCYGQGKLERFAKLIAGFTLALEISTYAAIVSGEFAKAHEKLGRNKPVKWLVKSEINLDFVRKCWRNESDASRITDFRFTPEKAMDNGILTNISKRISKKLTGFMPATVCFTEGNEVDVVIKSKATDQQIIKGLHIIAASIDTVLSDKIVEFQNRMEYTGCHLKELKVYKTLWENGFRCTPEYFGTSIDPEREIFLLFQEYLDKDNLLHINTQKTPEKWTRKQIEDTITSITEVHQFFYNTHPSSLIPEATVFEPWRSAPLYQKMVDIMEQESDTDVWRERVRRMQIYAKEISMSETAPDFPRTLIHNDFNSRNIAIRANGSPCIYDWELAVIDYPQRDVVELLSFVLKPDFSPEELLHYLHFQYNLYVQKGGFPISENVWLSTFLYSLKSYLVTRVSFYEVAGITARYAFSERVLNTALKMIEILEPMDTLS